MMAAARHHQCPPTPAKRRIAGALGSGLDCKLAGRFKRRRVAPLPRPAPARLRWSGAFKSMAMDVERSACGNALHGRISSRWVLMRQWATCDISNDFEQEPHGRHEITQVAPSFSELIT
jgi:hypothetical protein